MDHQIIIVTRTLNEELFIRPFLDYYISNGADKIIIFDSGSDDCTTEIIKAYPEINDKIIIIPTNRGFKDCLSQTEYNIEIWNYLIEKFIFKDIITYFIFVDVDEFICCVDVEKFEFKQLQNLNQYPPFQIYPSIFIERYPPIEKKLCMHKNIFNKNFINNIDTHFPYGRLQDLWDDVIYKYNVFRISKENVNDIKYLIPTSGFHRWISGRELFIEQSPFFLVNHIRILDWIKSIERINNRLNQIQNNQNMSWVHYNYVLDTIKKTQNMINSYDIESLQINRDFYYRCFERALNQNRYLGYYNEVIALNFIDEINLIKNNADYFKNYIQNESYVEGGSLIGGD